MSCKELIEQVSDYLERTIEPEERERFDEHLESCRDCQVYLGQMRLVLRALRGLKEETVPPEARERLLRAFRARPGARPPSQKTVPLGIGQGEEWVAPGDHIAYFWETEEDFERAVGFLEVGLRAADAGVVFGHESANQKVLDLLSRKGFDLASLMEKCRLYALGGRPSGDAMLAEIGTIFQTALAAGAPTVRLLGNIGWGRDGWPEEDGILEFEAKVTAAAQQFPCVVVCMYDVRALPGRIILKGGFETHPLTRRSGILRDNPHYVSMESFLAQLKRPGLLH